MKDMGIEEWQKVVFYFDVKDPRYREAIKIDFEKLKEKNIEIEFHEPIDDVLPEISVNGYMLAGTSDINHALNSLIS